MADNFKVKVILVLEQLHENYAELESNGLKGCRNEAHAKPDNLLKDEEDDKLDKIQLLRTGDSIGHLCDEQ